VNDHNLSLSRVIQIDFTAVLTIMKSGSLNLLEPSGPVQGCNGIALPLLIIKNAVLKKQKTLWISFLIFQHNGGLLLASDDPSQVEEFEADITRTMEIITQ